MDQIAIGRVRSSFGLDGSFKVQSYSGETEHFLTLRSIELSKEGKIRHAIVESVRVIGNSPLVKISGVDTPEAAKLLAGWDITVDRTFAAALAAGEYYQSDLVGLSVLANGVAVGTVASVYDGPQSVLLEVQTENGSRLLPFMDRFVGDIDVEARTIELWELWFLE